MKATENTNPKEQMKVVLEMLSEIEVFQVELDVINKNILDVANNASSEYGNRILEQLQNNLFYLQRILRRSTKSLSKYEHVLKEALGGSSPKSKVELQKYFILCLETATLVRGRYDKFKKETKNTIKIYGW